MNTMDGNRPADAAYASVVESGRASPDDRAGIQFYDDVTTNYFRLSSCAYDTRATAGETTASKQPQVSRAMFR